MAPKITDAPGLTWRKMARGWEARWRARTDLVKRGFVPPIVPLWVSSNIMPVPNEQVADYIADECQKMQSEMLIWGRGGVPILTDFDGTLKSLIECYKYGEVTPYKQVRYVSRGYYDTLCRRIEADHGTELVEDIRYKTLLAWHEAWSVDGKVSMAHSLMGMLRTLANFGSTILEDDQCARVATVMRGMRFRQAKPRESIITAEQANAVRAKAHEMGRPSIALAQAIQFECALRQKDVVGEWVPLSEPGTSEITARGMKWLRGLRWSEIDGNLILRHTTSKWQKDVEIDLKCAPMVMEELARKERKMVGPVIVNETTELPWGSAQFRRVWREIATAAGVPTTVRNMDSRAGAITEALSSGADMDATRLMATHGDISMTQRYSRNQAERTATVMKLRSAARNERETK